MDRQGYRFHGMLAGIVLALSGCAASPQHPPTRIIGIDDDPACDEVQFNGAEWFIKGFDASHLWLVRSSVDRVTGQARHQLYVELHYRGQPRHFNRASDEHGEALRVYHLDQQAHGCDSYRGCHVIESLGVDLSDDQLRTAADQGLKVHLLTGRGVDLPIAIRPDQARLQQNAIGQFLAKRAPVQPPADAVATVGGTTVNVSSNPVGVEANPVLGAALAELTPDQARARLRRNLKAVVVVDVDPDSVAGSAALQAGDILYEYDGRPIRSVNELHSAVASTLTGRQVPLRIIRGLQDLNLSAQF